MIARKRTANDGQKNAHFDYEMEVYLGRVFARIFESSKGVLFTALPWGCWRLCFILLCDEASPPVKRFDFYLVYGTHVKERWNGWRKAAAGCDGGEIFLGVLHADVYYTKEGGERFGSRVRIFRTIKVMAGFCKCLFVQKARPI